MYTIDDRRAKRNRMKYGKKILGLALDGFYYFEDDAIEDRIDRAEQKFAGRNRSVIRAWIMSAEEIREKICQVGSDIYG